MKNIKKVLVYPLAFVLFFGLTANECLDAVEDLTVDVPTTIVENFELVIPEEGPFEQVDVLDLSSPEVQEYRERIENFTINDIKFEVVDNLSDGSAETSRFTFGVKIDGNEIILVSDEAADIAESLEEISPDSLDDTKAGMEGLLKTADDPKVDFFLAGNAQGPIDYSITVTIDGVLEASAN